MTRPTKITAVIDNTAPGWQGKNSEGKTIHSRRVCAIIAGGRMLRPINDQHGTRQNYTRWTRRFTKSQKRYAATKSIPDLAVIYIGVESKRPCQAPGINSLLCQSKLTSGRGTLMKSNETQSRRFWPDSKRFVVLRLIPATSPTG